MSRIWKLIEPIPMRRRDMIILFCGIASAWPVVARAEASGMRRVGVLMTVSADDENGRDRLTAFRKELRERGWTEGVNLMLDVRWAGVPAGVTLDEAFVRPFAADLVALAPDVILAGNGLAVQVLLQITRTVPIVFTSTNNPLRYVSSLSRPGGNATGFSNIEFSFSPKYLELLKEIAPAITRVGVLRPPGYPAQLAEIRAAASSLRVDVRSIDMWGEAEIETAVAQFAAEPNGGLIVIAGAWATRYSKPVIDLAARHRLPAVYPNRLHVIAGGLVSYGPEFLDQFRGAADYADRILRGANPGDLPVHAPRTYEMALNLKTARALGLSIPRIIFARAGEIID